MCVGCLFCTFTTSFSLCRSENATCVRWQKTSVEEGGGKAAWRQKKAVCSSRQRRLLRVDGLTMGRKEMEIGWKKEVVDSKGRGRPSVVVFNLERFGRRTYRTDKKGGEMQCRPESGRSIEVRGNRRGRNQIAKCEIQIETKKRTSMQRRRLRNVVECKFGIGLSCCGRLE